MSYIYEALKRAEDENARGVVAPATARRPPFFATRPRWWLWALIAILGANAAVLVTLVLVRDSGSPGVTTTSTEPVAGPAVSPPRAAGAGQITPSAPPARAVAPTPPVARTVPPASSPVDTTAKPGRPAAATTTAAPPSARPVAPVPRVDPAPPTPGAVARDTARAVPASPGATGPAAPVAPDGSAGARPAPAAAVEGAAPPPVETPKLQIQVVLYSEVPAERMVIIDGRRYGEGQKVDAETVIERITPDGAVISRRGQRFALTSGRP